MSSFLFHKVPSRWLQAVVRCSVSPLAGLHWLLAGVLALSGVSVAAAAGEPLVICHGSVASALVPLAQVRGDYLAEGLDVQLRRFASGFDALQALLDGDCALSTAAVPPVVYQALRRGDFRIVAEISHSSDYERIVAYRDRGILAPADLRGRRIAVPKATSAHYFLDMFLAAQGLTPSDVTQVFLPAAEVGPAFRDGRVDAAAHWEPNVQNIAREAGERGQVFHFSGLVVSPFLLLARQDLIEKSPARVQGVLRALLRAERFMAETPAEAPRLLAPMFGISVPECDYVLSLHDYAVTLDQPLPFVLENATRWQIGLPPAAEQAAMPNYLNFIDAGPLRAVKPQAVSHVD
jgi:ABC-type nitrate/sulfonate/bicarbonate transport system substrate-binding protein